MRNTAVGAAGIPTLDANAPGSARPGPDLIFRMKSWPQLPEDGRTAEIYRMLSVMSSQPVNRRGLRR